MPYAPRSLRTSTTTSKQQHDQRRGSAASRGYDRRWRKRRAAYLRQHPLCVLCARVANVVDHIMPHRGDRLLFDDESNWQSLCKRCHDRKTGGGG